MFSTATGTRVLHHVYEWRGTIVEGPQAHLVKDDPTRVEVRWDTVGDRPYVADVSNLRPI